MQHAYCAAGRSAAGWKDAHRQHPVALLLGLVAVDGEGGPALGAQLASDGVAAALGLAEDEQPRAVHLALQQPAQRPVLVVLTQELELLIYQVVCLQPPRTPQSPMLQSPLPAGDLFLHGLFFSPLREDRPHGGQTEECSVSKVCTDD